MIEVRVEGLAELRKALLELPVELHKGPLRAAVSAGAKVVQDKAIALAPEGETGTLKRSIYRTRSRQGSSAVQETAIVGVRSGKKFAEKQKKDGTTTKSRDAFYWRFLEFGTWDIKAGPFMRPAFDTTKAQQLEAIREKLASSIQRIAAKLSRR